MSSGLIPRFQSPRPGFYWLRRLRSSGLRDSGGRTRQGIDGYAGLRGAGFQPATTAFGPACSCARLEDMPPAPEMMDDQPLEKLEPLGAPRNYEPLPTNKIFPAWEWTLRFGWIGALVVAGAAGYRFWKPETAKTLTPAQHFAPVAQWTRDPGFNLAPAIS